MCISCLLLRKTVENLLSLSREPGRRLSANEAGKTQRRRSTSSLLKEVIWIVPIHDTLQSQKYTEITLNESNTLLEEGR